MAKIQIMTSSLANKIAAGEVVERPSSVIKELIENAIDAGATKIDVTLTDSGIQSLRVTDNGCGMDGTDALLAFERHATSKLTNESDLFRISSLGFRGEALPSIAAVSDVHLTTSDGISSGAYVNIRGGKLIKNESAQMRKGTDIVVNHLFFNTPARLKYLKSESTELSYTVDYLNKLSLSHPEIAFKLVNNDRVLLSTTGNNNLVQVMASLYGIETAKKVVTSQYEDQYVKNTLYFTTPEINRTTRSYITLVVNNRIIKNNELINAVLDGYETYLPVNRYPIAVVQMTVDPLLVDVNVHPAKLIVRLSNEEHLKSLITSSIQKKLKEMMYVPEIVIPEKKEDPFEKAQEAFSFQEETKTDDKLADFFVREEKTTVIPAKKEPEKPVEPKAKLPKLYYIGQLQGTYLLAQNESGLYLIDQHAAQERINYEYYLRHLTRPSTEDYELLVPFTFNFSMNETLIIGENLDIIKNMNIEIEKFGTTGFIVHKIPGYLKRGNEKELLDELFAFILANKKVEDTALFKEIAATLACKRSIKANHYINELEVEKLLSDLSTCEQPYTCPHGRPVIIHLTYSEIEHLFKRQM